MQRAPGGGRRGRAPSAVADAGRRGEGGRSRGRRRAGEAVRRGGGAPGRREVEEGGAEEGGAPGRREVEEVGIWHEGLMHEGNAQRQPCAAAGEARAARNDAYIGRPTAAEESSAEESSAEEKIMKDVEKTRQRCGGRGGGRGGGALDEERCREEALEVE